MFVISKAEFSLSTLESGGSAVHPLAEEPTWEIPFDGRPSFEGAGTQIFGPYIAWQTPYDDNSIFEDRLQVRNWKTGCKVWVRSFISQLGSLLYETLHCPHGHIFVGRPHAWRFFVYVSERVVYHRGLLHGHRFLPRRP